jgi:hypothetical protein
MGMADRNDLLAKLGFSFERGGAHIARTMMFAELETLLAYANNPEIDKNVYRHFVVDENCLGKRSAKTRILTYRHLVDLYALDRNIILFRSLLYFRDRDLPARRLLALTCAYARDPVFRSTAPFILKFSGGTTISRNALEDFIDSQDAGRFSKATLKSTAQNINSTWTQSGHISGRAQKVRACATPSAGSVAYALLLGYLTGARGQALFQTEYAKLLDCTPDRAIGFAEEAARKGWIVFKRVGNVIEVLFPNLISQEEMEWLREQN